MICIILLVVIIVILLRREGFTAFDPQKDTMFEITPVINFRTASFSEP
jgi:hypothetical protein